MYNLPFTMYNMKLHYTLLFTLFTLLLASCDDGFVTDPVYESEQTGYNVKITGTFDGVDQWSDNYNVVVAAFSEDDEYSSIQKTIQTDGEETAITLSNVPSGAKIIEIAVTNTLRKRVSTFYRYEVENVSADDTIRIDVGKQNVSMFSAINNTIFQGTATTCSRCHSTEKAARGLDLSAENAYKNLVGVKSSKDATLNRVTAGDADNSMLYKIITDDSGFHKGFFSDYGAFVNIIKSWIDNGAKE